MPSIAEIFAELDLDSSSFDSKLANARAGMVTAAEDMAIPLGKVKQLLSLLSKEIGPTAAVEAMAQLAAQGNTAQQAVRAVTIAIQDLNKAQASQIAIQNDASLRQKEIFDRDRSAAQENLRAENQLNSARAEAIREDTARENQRLSQRREVASQIQQFEADISKAQKIQADAAIQADREVSKAHEDAFREDSAREDRRLAQKKAVDEQIASFERDLANAEKVRAQQSEENSRRIAQARQQEITQLNDMSQAMGSVGLIGAGVFGSLLASELLAAKSFADFDAALTHSMSILDDVPKVLRDQIGNAALELSTKFTFSAKEIAGAVYDIGSAGYNAEQSLSVLPVVVKFATAAFTDLDTATKLLTSSQSALGLRSDNTAENLANLTHIADVLVKADTLAAGTSKQFAQSLSNVGAEMRQLGVPLEAGIAGLAVLARQGIVGAEAGTQLAIVLRDLSTKAITNSEKWHKLGVDVYDASGNFNNFTTIIQQLEERFKGLSAEQVRFELIQAGLQQRSIRFTLALLGNAAAMKDVEAQAKSAGGTIDEVATKNLDTFNKRLDILKNRAEDVLIVLGQPFVGAMEGLIKVVTPAGESVEGMAKAFSSLPSAVQIAISGLTLGVTTLGTLGSTALLTSSYILQAAADIKILGGTAVAVDLLTTSLTSLAAALALPAFAVGVGAIAGIAGTAAIKNSGGNDIIAKAGAGTSTPSEGFGMEGAENAVADKVFMEQATQKLAAALGAATIAQNALALKTSDTGKAFRDLANAGADWGVEEQQSLSNAQKRFQAVKFNLKEIDDAFDLVKKARKEDLISEDEYQANLVGYNKARKAALADVTSAQKAAVKVQTEAMKEANDQTKKATEAQKRYREELAFFGVEIRESKVAEWRQKLGDLTLGYISANVTLENYNAALAEFNRRVTEIDLDKALKDVEDLTAKFQKVVAKKDWDDMRFGLSDIGEAMKKVTAATMDQITANAPLQKETKELVTAYHDLHLKSANELNEFAVKAVHDFELIRDSGTASPRLIQQAWVQAAIAQMDAGKEFSTRQLMIIAEIEEASKNGSKKIIDIARNTTKEISRLTDKLADQLVEGIAKLFDNSANEKLDKEISDLNKSMTNATAEFVNNQRDAASEIDKINSDLASSIAEEVQKQTDALAKETQAYNEFVADTQKKIGKVVETHQKAAAAEVKAVQDSLKKQQDEYNKFVADAQSSLAKLVDSHRRAQDQIRDDAARSLRDQTTDYNRFVEDTSEAIRKASSEGDLDSVRSLQTALARRREDFDTYRSDLAAKQAEDLEKDRQAQAQEIADVQNSIKDKQAALAEAQQVASDQISAITRKHQEAQAQEIADLVKSLAERAQAFEDYKVQNAKDLDKFIDDARAKAAEEVQAVKDKLAEQTRAYDEFRADYLAKLQELQDAHKSIFDRIGDLFKDMLTGFATELGKFIASTILKGLLGDLRKKFTDSFDLGTITDNWGKGASTTPPVNLPGNTPPGGNVDLPKGGGTPPTAPSGGSGSDGFGFNPSTVSAVSGVVSAVSDLIGNFQFYAMNKSLDIIVKHTLETVNELRNWRRDAWDQQTNLFFKLDDMWNEIRNVVDILRLIGIATSGVRDNTGGEGGTKSLAELIAEVINGRPASVDGSTQALLDSRNLNPASTSNVYDSLPYAVRNNTDSINSNTESLTALRDVVQGVLPSQLPRVDDSRVYEPPNGQGSGAVSDKSLLLQDQWSELRSQQMARPGAASGAAMVLVDPGAPKSSLAYDIGFQNRDRPTSYFGPGANEYGARVNVTINVPNPDGDLVAANLIDAVQKRGVNLR